MTVLVALPVLLPLLAAGLSLALGRFADIQRALGLLVLGAIIVDAAVLLYVADRFGPVVLQMGAWPAPFGITLVADRLSALLLMISSVVTFAVLIYSIGQRITDYGRERSSTTFHPMYLMLCAGVSLAYLTGDLFNLFVAFEIMLSSSYVLITRRTTATRVRAGMTYVIVSLASSLLFITMIALVYASTGTVNLADLGEKVHQLPDGLQIALALLVVIVFGVKAAMVPLHFWLPDSYPTAPAPVTAVFAGLLTKVGIYALIRTQTLVFSHSESWNLMLGIALITMVVGALGALAQNDLNRLLSFLLVSHIGYMLFGLGVYDVVGLTGVILYVVHHITVQAALFLVSGLITRHTGTVALTRMGGLAKAAPMIAVLFALPALTLAGVPPFSGFVAKLALLQAGVGAGTWTAYAVTGGLVLTSLLTLYAMARVWTRAFWGQVKAPEQDPDPTDELVVGTATSNRPMVVASGVLVATSVVIALVAGPLAEVSGRAAEDLMHGETYRSAVLGGAVE
ncbi:multicomponent Na+:H+ antiporter subunit D [Saccharopolyspora antimicrobica]|uniref:Multicomponent Na+:H+ antiporter subunit D n=2 Tax=Saccharopolyspora TaxID=1835 RepID=A0A1I5HDD5_9PSEU|nr:MULTISPECIES: Na+/H+ antiporter subunit D [Saccharopolyspora]RKT85357.1 multisubunit sodium/proton antiporter MrpD subunit [Saccharopolyspora antimicrobica]SEG94635.1 multisubunit sodium/proton antiporter, MrpD subunit (TC 2.A.63.1) [Saccharopolyspora kobensis]SFD63932.1 multisubunit sodium/proton antiporter, MrpD subunit [Saccharopolyspora kobensis]SFO46284.1 multicomponent Na+:H+ antiporter subunit D [Saccharopolyspora antimicrobica]